MHANDVTLGHICEVSVDNRVTSVKAISRLPEGGWMCVSEKSGKVIRIKNVDRFKALPETEAASSPVMVCTVPEEEMVQTALALPEPESAHEAAPAEVMVAVETEPIGRAEKQPDEQERILEALLNANGRLLHIDEIVAVTGIPIYATSSALMLLELKKKAIQHPGKMFTVRTQAIVRKEPFAVKEEVVDPNEPHAFCCGCGRRLANRSKWYCGDECRQKAKTGGVRHCWNCGKPVAKGMTCETC